jgi:hypothetical protein
MAELDPDLFRRMQEAALRFRSGESDFEEIMTPNGPAHLVRDPTNPLGFRIDFVGGASRRSVSVQEYPASLLRPHGYPAPLPFLAGCAATVNTLDQAVTWLDPADPENAVAEISRQCTEDGWAAADARSSDGAHVGTFTKDGVVRTLRLDRDRGAVRVSLTERRPPDPH